VVRPNQEVDEVLKDQRLIHLKFHFPILDHLVILRVRITGNRAEDTLTLGSTLRTFPSLPGSVFDADRCFDEEKTFRRLHELEVQKRTFFD
jgi:hypothetical protein